MSHARNELWDALGIDPDRISREEFEEHMDAYHQALADQRRPPTRADLQWAGVELRIGQLADDLDELMSSSWVGRLALRLTRRYAQVKR